jgi:hypothetical protein
MPDELPPRPDLSRAEVYRIRIKGHLGPEWSDWFGGLTISLEDSGETMLTGPVIDQAALYGLLRKLRDVGLTLISVVSARGDGEEPGVTVRTLRKTY